MEAEMLAELLERVRRGRVSVRQALEKLRHLPFEDLGFAKVDHHRALRQGFPEVILGEGKEPSFADPSTHLLSHGIALTSKGMSLLPDLYLSWPISRCRTTGS